MRRGSACFPLVAAFVLLVTNAAFAAMSEKTLYRQLDRLGFVASKDEGRHTTTIHVGGDRQRVLHLAASALSEKDETQKAA